MNGPHLRTPWAPGIGVALALHGAVLLWALWRPAPAWQAPTPDSLQAVMLELAPSAQAPAAPPTELAPGPPQQEQRAAAAQPQQTPRSVLPLPERAQAEEALPTPSDSAAPAATEVATAGDRARALPSLPVATGSRVAAPVDSAGTAQQQATWQSHLLAHLEKYRGYPRQARRRGWQGAVHLRFLVDRQGRVSGAAVALGSGRTLLDDEALATLTRAAPLPPPPASLPGDPLEVVVPVSFFLDGR